MDPTVAYQSSPENYQHHQHHHDQEYYHQQHSYVEAAAAGYESGSCKKNFVTESGTTSPKGYQAGAATATAAAGPVQDGGGQFSLAQQPQQIMEMPSTSRMTGSVTSSSPPPLYASSGGGGGSSPPSTSRSLPYNNGGGPSKETVLSYTQGKWFVIAFFHAIFAFQFDMAMGNYGKLLF